jgi:hypothetical protein
MKKIDIEQAPTRFGTMYPEPYDVPCLNRKRWRLGAAAGLTGFGVNLCRLPPGTWSSQRHWHSIDDEFIYVVEGEVVLVTDAGEEVLKAGDCAGFRRVTRTDIACRIAPTARQSSLRSGRTTREAWPSTPISTFELSHRGMSTRTGGLTPPRHAGAERRGCARPPRASFGIGLATSFVRALRPSLRRDSSRFCRFCEVGLDRPCAGRARP